jgi:hypothetical protein
MTVIFTHFPSSATKIPEEPKNNGPNRHQADAHFAVFDSSQQIAHLAPCRVKMLDVAVS